MTRREPHRLFWTALQYWSLTHEGAVMHRVDMERCVDGNAARVRFVRFRATTANRRGIQPGVFALVNGLASAGRLSAAEERFRRASNDWFTAHLIDPTTVDPGLFRDHPLAVSWFAEAASDLLERIPGYLRILERHSIDWERASTLRPGRIVYSDAHQVLATVSASGTST